MLIDFSQTLTDMAGAAIADDTGPVTLSRVACNALLAISPDDAKISGEDKAKRYKLAVTLVDAEATECTAEEIALVKKLVGIAYGPLIVGKAYELLEGKT